MSEELLGADLAFKLRRLMETREERDQTKQAAEKAEKEYRDLEQEVWADLEESPVEGTVKVNIGAPYGVVSFGPRETHYGRVIDNDAALEYFEAAAVDEEFTTRKISKARVNELVRERIENGQGMPPGLDFYGQRRIAISRQKS